MSYGPKWPKMAIFGCGRISYVSTPNFGPNSMKLNPIVWFTKKKDPVQVWARFESELRRNGRLSVGPKREQMAKTPFFAI